MSELKAFTFSLGRYTEDGYPCVVAVDDEDNPRLASDEKFYLKSEADKVIARHKYKRCLAMARGCRLRGRLFGACGLYEKELWALKWHKRWLELAEKFKEGK